MSLISILISTHIFTSPGRWLWLCPYFLYSSLLTYLPLQAVDYDFAPIFYTHLYSHIYPSRQLIKTLPLFSILISTHIFTPPGRWEWLCPYFLYSSLLIYLPLQADENDYVPTFYTHLYSYIYPSRQMIMTMSLLSILISTHIFTPPGRWEWLCPYFLYSSLLIYLPLQADENDYVPTFYTHLYSHTYSSRQMRMTLSVVLSVYCWPWNTRGRKLNWFLDQTICGK